jgi:hypothetical protein
MRTGSRTGAAESPGDARVDHTIAGRDHVEGDGRGLVVP